MIKKTARLLAPSLCAALLLGAAPAAAQFAPASPAANSVSAFYSSWHSPSIWFTGGTADPGVWKLIAILKRAPFDGLASGPQLAAQVEAATLQAGSGKPADIAAADRTLSTAWVEYVQAIKRPT